MQSSCHLPRARPCQKCESWPDIGSAETISTSTIQGMWREDHTDVGHPQAVGRTRRAWVGYLSIYERGQRTAPPLGWPYDPRNTWPLELRDLQTRYQTLHEQGRRHWLLVGRLLHVLFLASVLGITALCYAYAGPPALVVGGGLLGGYVILLMHVYPIVPSPAHQLATRQNKDQLLEQALGSLPARQLLNTTASRLFQALATTWLAEHDIDPLVYRVLAEERNQTASETADIIQMLAA